MVEGTRSAQEKALQINLDHEKVGTFAEIGAGQEVAGWFFHAGKAASTVAKTISAYDMAVSDAIYGPTGHYVSRARLEAMLDHEYPLLIERLSATRGQTSAFFVFADTAATHGSSRSHAGHAWLGVRFQTQPGTAPSDVIVHIEMLEPFAANQRETVGRLGVNLLHGALYLYEEPARLVQSLMDGLDRRRAEVDMIKFSGPAFPKLDNRLMSLQLVEQGLTDTAMFTAAGEVVQSSEVLHGKPVLLERGSFRPVTHVTLGMLEAATRQLPPDCEMPVIIMEMTLKNLLSGEAVDHSDFLARADILGAFDKTVMISNYTRFDCVTSYLRQYTQNRIGMVVGVPTLREIFEEKYYTELEGGILEGLGRLFSGAVKMYAYPTLAAEGGDVMTAAQIHVDPRLKHLYGYVLENGFIEEIREFDTGQLHVSPGEVLRMIQAGEPSWEALVPEPAARVIRREGLFGFRASSK